MTVPVVIRTGCKIVWFLRIGPKRPDGYHDLQTLFIPLDAPHDELQIRPGTAPGLRVICAEPGIAPEHNTLTTAYRLWRETTGGAPDLELTLIKGVPHGAGLGGGSADAAGLLLHLQEWAGTTGRVPLSPEVLNALAARVGADVPFFLLNKPALAEGIGERLREVPNPAAGRIVLTVCPPVEVSTAWAFATLDAEREKNEKSKTNGLTRTGPKDNTTFSCGANQENDFQEVVFRAFPELVRIRDGLLEYGATAARMSGSGSTVFGVFTKIEQAERTVATMPHRAYIASFAGA